MLYKISLYPLNPIKNPGSHWAIIFLVIKLNEDVEILIPIVQLNILLNETFVSDESNKSIHIFPTLLI